MKLRFYARGDMFVLDPEARLIVGNPPRYIGREYRKVDNAGALASAEFPASEAAFECESESITGQRLVKLCRREQSLWPADEATAALCSVPFQRVEFDSGEWVPAKKPVKTKE